MSVRARISQSDTYASDLISQVSRETSSYTPGGYRNVFINGDFRVAQRPNYGTATSTQPAADRWRAISNGHSLFQQVKSGRINSDVEASPYAEGFDKIYEIGTNTANPFPNSGNYIEWKYAIEGHDAQIFKKGHSNGSSFCLTFWVWTNKPGTYASYLYDANNSRSCYRNWSVPHARRWVKIKLRYPPDPGYFINADNGQNLRLYLGLSYASNYVGTLNDGSWTSHASSKLGGASITNFGENSGNIMRFAGFQLEPDYFTPFEHLPYSVQLERCQRYYQVINGNDYENIATAHGTSAAWYVPIILPGGKMRRSPDLEFSSVSHFRVTLQHSSTDACTSVGIGYGNDTVPNLSVQAGSNSAGSMRMFGFTAQPNMYLAFDADF